MNFMGIFPQKHMDNFCDIIRRSSTNWKMIGPGPTSTPFGDSKWSQVKPSEAKRSQVTCVVGGYFGTAVAQQKRKSRVLRGGSHVRCPCPHVKP